MHCPQCQHQSTDTAKFCEECGVRLVTACAQCGQQVSPAAKFCPECGNALTLGQKGKRGSGEKTKQERAKRRSASPKSQSLSPSAQSPAPSPQSPVGERRQLTVMFIDLVGSTALSARLDPEDYQTVVQTYQATSATIIERYAGHIAQHLGDGLLVYFGYPTAHEDDAVRAVRSALEIVAAVNQLQLTPPLQVRIGIHTGPVVVGEIGGGTRREQLAVGETPNVAARIQGLAAPDTVAVSVATYRLVSGFFDCQALSAQSVKGIATPIEVYRVLADSIVQHRLDAVPLTGLTPLVGREEELALLQRRWEQVKDREGQVVLLSGEPGIGKSRLVRELRNRVEQDNAIRIEFRCSPYYQNSALHPVIEHVQHLLQWQKEDTVQTRTAKLQTTLARYQFPQTDTLALFAALLSLPYPPDAPPLNLSPQRQKQKTEAALIAWLLEEAEHAPVYCAWEDLHWADPSTLELLEQLIDQAATARLFILLTGRPEFTSPWGQHGHFSQLTLSRLGRRQVPQLIEQATDGKTLPAEVIQQIVAKTDGVPLFIEELTKMVLESGLLTETNGHYELSGPLPLLAIPSTLQDSLMARLDRLATTKEIAQLGATIGREFPYELLHAVSPLNEQVLQNGLKQLVETELIYQRGMPPYATYLFKHALIQDTAYQSLLKSRRQQLHQQIAQVLEERFPDTKDSQPELLAHHYTEAGLITQAIPYWQQAGQQAVQRSANAETISHLTKGLEVLENLPDTLDRAQQELSLQTTIGPAWMAVKGYAAPEVERAYSRARALCTQLGEMPQLFTILRGLWSFYVVRAELRTAQGLGEQLLQLAQDAQDPALFLEAHYMLGETLYYRGEFSSAYAHIERGVALYDLQQHRSHAFLYGTDPGSFCFARSAYLLWLFGYSDQARKRSEEALALAQELAHANSLAAIFIFAAWLYHLYRNEQKATEWAAAAITLSTEHGLPFSLAAGESCRGWLLAEQGQIEEGITQIRQGLSAYRATGAGVHWYIQPLIALTEVYRKVDRPEEGLNALTEATNAMNSHDERWLEAELYRLRGELILQQFKVQGSKPGLPAPVPQAQVSSSTLLRINSVEGFKVEDSPESSVQSPESEVEECFWKAIEIARKQQAKSLELRATMSLARLWQQQGKQHEAHKMLSELYNWFTEGFDTKDLQEAKALLESLASSV